MARFRLILINLAIWLTLLFNLERPDLLGFGNIDLASMVYVLCAAATVIILMFPELSQLHTSWLFIPMLAVYLALKGIIGAPSGHNLSISIIVVEIVALFMTVHLARLVSSTVYQFENIVENTVLATNNSRVLGANEGIERINKELFRSRRFNHPSALIFVEIPHSFSPLEKQLDLQLALKHRYIQGRVAKIIEDVVYLDDIIALYHDHLVICFPETSRDRATEMCKQIYKLLKATLDLDVKMGITVFPDDALIFDELVNLAAANVMTFGEEEAKPVVIDLKTASSPSSGKVLADTLPFKESLVSSSSLEQGQVPATPKTDKSGQKSHDDDDDPPRLPPSSSSGPENDKDNSFSYTVKTVVTAFTKTPDLLPPSSLIISSNEHYSATNDPEFWVNKLPYQSGTSRLIFGRVKRLVDVALVLLSLPLTLPLLIGLSLAVYLDSGRPIFFTQPRTGKGGRRFNMYKFRTMVPNAEALLKDLAAQGYAKLDKDGKLAEPLKMARDPRITRLGQILRKTSLDELPQLFNVLLGDMSIVGPRPTSWDIHSYTLLQTERLSVRPGITGLWQVCSRGTTDFDIWFKWDLKYIEKMSFLLDLKIMIWTFRKVLTRSGAR